MSKSRCNVQHGAYRPSGRTDALRACVTPFDALALGSVALRGLHGSDRDAEIRST